MVNGKGFKRISRSVQSFKILKINKEKKKKKRRQKILGIDEFPYSNGFDIFQPLPNLSFPFDISTNPQSIHNLTGKILNPTILKFLTLGLNFALPDPFQTNESAISSLDQFIRKLKIKEQFQFASSSSEFYVPNPTFVPNEPSAPLIQYIKEAQSKLHDELTSQPPVICSPHLHSTFQACIKSLRADTSIHIHAADKNAGLVIMNREDYKMEALRQLSDNTTYLPLTHFPSPSVIFNNLKELLIFYECPPPDIKYILQLQPHQTSWAKLYFLTKIHKPAHPGRPICSQINTLTYYASKYLHTKLMPFVKLIPTRMSDPILLVHKLNNMEFTENCVLLTADIASLYPNIDHIDGIAKFKEFLNTKRVCEAEVSLLTALLTFVLNNNWFTFGTLKYRQIKGTAMGTPCAVMYADIYIHQLELNTLHTLAQPFTLYIPPTLHTRWIDDIFQIYTDYNSALLYINTFNTQHPNIQIPQDAIQIGQKVNFLDMTIYRTHKNTRSFSIKLYTKPMNSHQYLHFYSHHPQHIFTSFINSELNRILLRSSTINDYKTTADIFYSNLLKRDYSSNFLDPIFEIHRISSSSSDEYYIIRNKLINQRISNIRSSNKVTPLTLMHASQSRVNWKRILDPALITQAPPYLSVFNNRPPVIGKHNYNTISKHITSSTFPG